MINRPFLDQWQKIQSVSFLERFDYQWLWRSALWLPSSVDDAMIYILYSAYTANNFRLNLGLPEYSYFFLRESFRAMLEKRHSVIVVEDPEREVDAIYNGLLANGENCVLLSFSPPHKTCLGLRCPTIPVFAWEYDTIPQESWDDEPRHDWTYVLSRLGCAITLSQYAVDAVKSVMGQDFPIVSIPAPVSDRPRHGTDRSVKGSPRQLTLQANILDSHNLILPSNAAEASSRSERKPFSQRMQLTGRHFLDWYGDVVRDLLPVGIRRGLGTIGKKAIRLGGRAIEANNRRRRASDRQLAPPDCLIHFSEEDIVYTTVFAPYDSRKNWVDMVTAFCATLSDRNDATLVLKFINRDNSTAIRVLRDVLTMMPPFKCRIIAIDGYLDEATYRTLIDVTTYVVNASAAEGLCLPVMEFMSQGKPAIGPYNTALCDYLDENVAFIVRSSKEICGWPHDTRIKFRAHKYRIDWESLSDAYRESYHLAKKQTALYEDMAKRAAIRLHGYCSEETVHEKLQDFLRRTALRGRSPAHPGHSCPHDRGNSPPDSTPALKAD